MLAHSPDSPCGLGCFLVAVFNILMLHTLKKCLIVGLQVWLRGVGVFIVITLLEAAMRASVEMMGQQV